MRRFMISNYALCDLRNARDARRADARAKRKGMSMLRAARVPLVPDDEPPIPVSLGARHR